MSEKFVGIKVSGTDAEAIKAHVAAIEKILKTPHLDQKTLQLALKVYGESVKAPVNTTITNCVIEFADHAAKKRN